MADYAVKMVNVDTFSDDASVGVSSEMPGTSTYVAGVTTAKAGLTLIVERIA